MDIKLLHIRAGQENERGPLYMEPTISAIHSLKKNNKQVHLEVGVAAGKIALYARGSRIALHLTESQLYAQYPDVDIERLSEDPFVSSEDEYVVSSDLQLVDPEVFPIKRHPQFDDMLTRVNVDSLAGITSALSRYPDLGMRGHVQVIMMPIGTDYRRRAIRFLPLLEKGLASISENYACFFARMQLARGWRRVAYMPMAMAMGGFRVWPGFGKFLKAPSLSGDISSSDSDYDEAEKVTTRSHDREDSVSAAMDKVNRLLFVCTVRVSVIYKKGSEETALGKLSEIAGSFSQFSLPNCNAFEEGKVRHSNQIDYSMQSNPYVLSTEEIATLWHLPTILVQTPNLDWVISKKLEPPLNLPIMDEENIEDLTVIGESIFRGEKKRFGIKPIDRTRHIYCIGKTGMGKSTVLENMVFSDIQAGKGVGVIDPHGDLIDAILEFVPKERSNDVVLFDPSDTDYPISFNILECADKEQRVLVASGIMSVFTKLWPDVWSGRMEHILRNTLLALLENEGTSMLGIMRVFADDNFRHKIVSRVTDPLVKSFWVDEYESWSEKYRTEAIAAIQNKVGQLLSTPLIRNIIGQVKSTLDIRHAMDSGKIILVNLSKGKLGEDASAFLGSMLVTKFQIDAMSRADIPEKDRRPFYLYVDEFQNFATESFATILSEARKYKLCLTMANQYIGQLLIGDKSTALKDAVFGNVGSIVAFQVGSDDAEVFSLQFEELVLPKDILSLPKYHAYVRLMIDGMPGKPFSVQSLPPPEYDHDDGRSTMLRRLSRERYTEKRSVVEEKINKWAASAAEARGQSVAAGKAKEKEEEEMKKARKKKMSLEEYRTWRDKEMWSNDFNALRKRALIDEDLNDAEKKQYADLQKKLKESGGVPPLSKAVQELVDKKSSPQASKTTETE
ncbi:MAG: type IV secretion system DNA-binding domain-containing protein [bacterium]|nr:type IV secretion system DNA-binding domain-containing protein [bacterium]